MVGRGDLYLVSVTRRRVEALEYALLHDVCEFA